MDAHRLLQSVWDQGETCLGAHVHRRCSAGYMQAMNPVRNRECIEFKGTEPPHVVGEFIAKFQQRHADNPPLKGKKLHHWKCWNLLSHWICLRAPQDVGCDQVECDF